MKLTSLIWICFPACFTIGQNLVPNSGFDDLIDCPDDYGQIALAFPWVSATTNMFNTCPNIYNTCSNISGLIPPNAGIRYDSYQAPRSGDGYTGLFVWRNDNVNVNEYIAAPLIDKLEKSKQYYGRFYVSPDLTNSMLSWCYTDAVGLALSDTFYLREIGGHDYLAMSPVIENRGILIKDTLHWTKISGCFVANGDEKYVYIGNFRPDNETLVEISDPNIQPYYSYFYLEDVLIQAFDPLPDTLLLCDGQAKTLNAAFLDATYLWNTGATDSTLFVQSPGVYTVEAFMENCVLRDTVVVLDTRDTGGFQPDTTICADEPITLTAPLPGSYFWSDGSTDRDLEVSSTGSYAVTVTNDCGQFSFSVQVEAMDCACHAFVPNAISPNGDGINDELRVYFGCDYEYRILRFAVFDRWGGQVYKSGEGETPAWDGSARGNPAVPGTYVWFLEYETLRNGMAEKHLEKGEVNLIR